MGTISTRSLLRIAAHSGVEAKRQLPKQCMSPPQTTQPDGATPFIWPAPSTGGRMASSALPCRGATAKHDGRRLAARTGLECGGSASAD